MNGKDKIRVALAVLIGFSNVGAVPAVRAADNLPGDKRCGHVSWGYGGPDGNNTFSVDMCTTDPSVNQLCIDAVTPMATRRLCTLLENSN